MNLSTISPLQICAAVIFAMALIHTFSTPYFERLARTDSGHAGVWHLLAEVEVIFGFWAMVSVALMFALQGRPYAIGYLESRDFTEPMFVFAVMVIAGTRPVLQTAMHGVQHAARALPLAGSVGTYLVVMIVVPLAGSLITEPAAMTLAALILNEQIFSRGISERLKYATLGVLFVNISVGGTLTAYAAPPVLMVAGQWGWDSHFMLVHFGWKAALAVVVNAVGVTFVFRKELANLLGKVAVDRAVPLPTGLVMAHVVCLAGTVVFAHHPVMFMGIFLLFLGMAHAYQRHQDRLIFREALLVAFFLAGLVVLGGQQQWWLQPALMGLGSDQVFLGAMVLTAFTDNAALTYLGSLVEGLSDSFKYALVAGAVTGGGLTIIANAPNPAGNAILRGHFKGQAVHPLGLLLSAAAPTVVAAVFFWML